MRIALHVERLILDGLTVAIHDRGALQSAFEGELTRLLNECNLHETLVRGATLPSLRGASLQLTAGITPNELGVQVAQAVYGGMSR